jgi:hypothetical protein
MRRFKIAARFKTKVGRFFGNGRTKAGFEKRYGFKAKKCLTGLKQGKSEIISTRGNGSRNYPDM